MNRIYLMGNSSGGHVAMMSVLFHAHGLIDPLPGISGVIAESASTDLLICAEAPLPPWLKVRPSAVLLGVDRIADSSAHGGATYFSGQVLDLIQTFCEASCN